MELRRRIELRSAGYESAALPLSYHSLVGPPGFEPGLLRLKGGYAAGNILAPRFGSGPPNRTEIISVNSRAHDRCARPEYSTWYRAEDLNPDVALIGRTSCR